LSEEVSETLQEVCLEISQRYEIHFLEIGFDEDHVHFLIQSVPMLSPKKIVNTVKSLTAREIFRLHPEVKRFLWGGKFWTSGYGSRSKVVGIDLNSELCGSNFIDVIRSLISDS
tara:strand:- start:2902 stop:3243 length:342 start_codon:yes stop_codon:yes gene_type:complete